MRYVQVKNEDGSYELIPATEWQAPASPNVFVQRDVDPFRSVVDGSVVTSQRTLREHNRRNNVVHESEYGSQKDRERFWEHKASERADVYQGTANTAYGKDIARKRKQAIAEALRKHEQH